MEVKILKSTFRETTQRYEVDFATEFGVGHAGWFSKRFRIPQLSCSYGVELETDEILAWGDRIVASTDARDTISFRDGVLTLCGKFETVDPDGVVCIRMGTSIMLLETIGIPPAEGSRVQIRIARLVLAPHDKYEMGGGSSYYQRSGAYYDVIPTSKVGSLIEPSISATQPVDVFTPTTYRQFIGRYGDILQEYKRLEIFRQECRAHEPEIADEAERRVIYRSGMSMGEVKQERLERAYPELKQMNQLKEQRRMLRQEFLRRLPVCLLAVCPYCGSSILQPVDVFSLLGFAPGFYIYEIYEGGVKMNNQPPRQWCPHMIVTMPFVNLNGLPLNDLPGWAVDQVWRSFYSAPYVLVWPLIACQTSAVIHALPIGLLDDPEPVHRYTVYFVSYFIGPQSNMNQGMWIGGTRGVAATAGVKVDHDLIKWVKAGRLHWLNPEDNNQLVQGPVETFPYANIQPQGWYEITKGGKVSEPQLYFHASTYYQGPAPAHDESFPDPVD